MAVYTATPKDWANGSTVAATDLDDHLRDLALAFGAWGSYTPTLGGFTAGNGTASGFYAQVQKTVLFRAQFTFGSTSAAASAYPTLTLPVTAKTGTFFLQNFAGGFRDDSPGVTYQGVVWTPSDATLVRIGILGSSGASGACTTTTPFTWATGDMIFASGTYEAA